MSERGVTEPMPEKKRAEGFVFPSGKDRPQNDTKHSELSRAGQLGVERWRSAAANTGVTTYEWRR